MFRKEFNLNEKKRVDLIRIKDLSKADILIDKRKEKEDDGDIRQPWQKKTWQYF